ncbi:hypothetical protein HDA35_001901 [Micromonospora purpureochromogenes]|uniref:PEP-CTERM protein-sorting domain-containing protein n=1 Tax=Micromonospora purpureochromogenes TaxID=47872 RepID=A0ABX2RHU9_9ACTN|nr:hypothetical protein [Micromonospora purpureochromogenes]
MVALKLWHLMICVLLPTAAILGGVWAVRRSRNRR